MATMQLSTPLLAICIVLPLLGALALPPFGATRYEIVPKENDVLPQQVHIALTNNADEMVISWVTDHESKSIVQYGLESPGALDMIEDSTDPAFQYSYGAEVRYTSGFIHHVTLHGLDPSTTYVYRCGDGTVEGMSKLFKFTTPPPLGPETPLRVGVMGDLGQTKFSAATVQHIADAMPLDMVMHVGDLSYADGFQPRWDRWGRMVEPVTSQLAWMYAAGNHEYELLYGPDDDRFVAFQSRFRMPSPSKGGNGNLYYSYNVGPVHAIVLCSYTDFSESSAQFEWLQRDLSTVDRSSTPWLVVYFHAPWYNSNKAHQNESESVDMRASMEDTLFNANVDIIFCGHVHSYERMNRVYRNELNDNAPIYVNVGDGGNREGLEYNWFEPQPSWSAFRQPAYGHGILQFYNSSYGEFSWHRDIDGERIMTDSVALVH
eukprot:Rmarinus@m.26185